MCKKGNYFTLSHTKQKLIKTDYNWPQTSVASKLGGMQNGEFGTVSIMRAMGWELHGQELSTWDYLQPGRTPFSGRIQNSRKGRMYPAPTSCRTASTTSNGKALQNRQDRLKNPLLQGTHPQEKDRKRNVTRSHFILLSGRQNTLVPRALFHWGPQCREIRNQCSNGGIRAQSSLSFHTELPSAPSRRVDPLTQMGPSLKTDS